MSEKEVELSKVLALLYKYKSKLLIISICSSLVFFGLSFLLNDQYTTSSTLKLTNSENDSSSSSPLGSLSRVAGISGLNLGAQNTDAYYAIEMFKSRDFFKHLNIVNPNLLTFMNSLLRRPWQIGGQLCYDLNDASSILAECKIILFIGTGQHCWIRSAMNELAQ